MSPSDIAYITRTAEKIALTVSLSMTVYRPSHWPNRRVQTRPPNAIALKPPTVRSANNQCGRSSKRIIRAARGALLVIGKNHAVSWTAPSHWGANTSTSWNGVVRHSGDRPPMSALGHVWTAPWQELSDVSAALVGCGHVSGLFVRPMWPLAIMLCADRVPIVNTHSKMR